MALISPSAYRRRFDPNSGINMSNNPVPPQPTTPSNSGGSSSGQGITPYVRIVAKPGESGKLNRADLPLGYTGGDPYAWIQDRAGALNLPPTTASLESLFSAINAGGGKAEWATRAGGKRSDDKGLLNGTMYDLIRDVGGPGAAWQFSGAHGGGGANDPRPGTPEERARAAGGVDPLTGFKSGGVFDDPATKEWEQLLRTLNQRLQQPQPTYTPEQRDLMQTQAIDPLERLRQVQKQNTTQRFASRGIAPGSGILEQALQDVDRQFDQMRSQQQTGFAMNQIGREDQLFNSNEQRALAGLNLFKQVPQMADSRLMMANSMLIPSNPYQTLALQNQVAQQGQQNQQYQDAQNQQFWLWLGQMMANAFQ